MGEGTQFCCKRRKEGLTRGGNRNRENHRKGGACPKRSRSKGNVNVRGPGDPRIKEEERMSEEEGTVCWAGGGGR